MATIEDFYRVIEQIPTGKVATYGQVAGWAGSPGAAQAVGNALRNRPAYRALPWQRVVNGDGKRGVLSASAPANQRKLLEDEGISFEVQGFIRLERYGWGGPGSLKDQPVLEAPQDDLDDLDAPPSTDLHALDDAALFRLYADVMQEIRHRGLSKGMNNPIADYAEKLVAKALHAEVMPQSNTGFDLRGPGDIRYEVKARRMNRDRSSRQLSALRNLKDRHFDFLVGVLFNEDFTVYRAAIIPWEVVRDNAVYRPHTNAWVFHLRDGVWNLPGVKDLALDHGASTVS